MPPTRYGRHRPERRHLQDQEHNLQQGGQPPSAFASGDLPPLLVSIADTGLIVDGGVHGAAGCILIELQIIHLELKHTELIEPI